MIITIHFNPISIPIKSITIFLCFLEVFLNYVTLVFMLVGFTSLFASFGLKQATLKVREKLN